MEDLSLYDTQLKFQRYMLGFNIKNMMKVSLCSDWLSGREKTRNWLPGNANAQIEKQPCNIVTLVLLKSQQVFEVFFHLQCKTAKTAVSQMPLNSC